jgi:hypothetical protein
MLKPRSFPLILRLGLIVGVLLATLSVGTTLLIRSSKAASPIARSPVVHTSARDYWTTERMNSAFAESIPRVSTPSPTRSGTTTLAYSTDATTTETLATLATPVDHRKYTHAPASFVGKVFYHSPGENKDTVCSGTAIKSNNVSIVDTAGHCLYGFGAWHTNVMFCPQYYYGNGPAGCWSESQLYTPDSWLSDQHNFIHDFGMIVVQPDTQNTHADLADCYPNLPLATLQSLTTTAYGYPKLDAFDGEQMYVASGPNGSYASGDGTMLYMNNNDMTGGASGGPWFVTYKDTIYLIGHNDTHNGNTMNSPYYGDEWLNLLDKAQNDMN